MQKDYFKWNLIMGFSISPQEKALNYNLQNIYR